MFNQTNKKEISFEGRGNLFIKYYTYSEELGAKFLEKLKETKAIGEIGLDIKSYLLKHGFINEANEFVGLPPQRVVIKDGTDYFDEANIQNANFVFQKGGVLEEPLNAKTVVVGGGTNVEINAENVNLIGQNQHSGDIYTDFLRARNTVIENPAIAQKKVIMTNSSNKSILNCERGIVMYGTSKLSNARIGGDLDMIFGKSEVENAVIKKCLQSYGGNSINKVKIGDRLIIWDNSFPTEVKNAEINHGLIVNGRNASKLSLKNIKALNFQFHLAPRPEAITLSGHIQGKLYKSKGVNFSPTVKLDKKARKSLPLSQFKLKYGPSHRYNPNSGSTVI